MESQSVKTDELYHPQNYYLTLAEHMEFPPWFTHHKNGVLTVPICKKIPGANIYNFISDKFKKGKLVGKDSKFKYYLVKVMFTLLPLKATGKFLVKMTFRMHLREAFANKFPKDTRFIYEEQIEPIYEIYAPVFQ